MLSVTRCRCHSLAVAALCTILVAGCTSDGDAGASTAGPQSTGVLSGGATLPPLTSPPTTVRPTPSTIAPALLDACVQLVQFGAFTGSAELMDMWNTAGQDPAVLRDNCDGIGRIDAARLQNLADQWRDVQAFLAASSTSTTTP